MRLLLDTHILLWALGRVDLLPQEMVSQLNDSENQVYFSVINIWEMVIKTALPRRGLHVDPVKARQQSLGMGFFELPVTAQHAFAVGTLQPLHRDPFDRMLIAQARIEAMQLITVDAQVQRYLS